MRKGEIQDKTYHFVSEEEFLDKLNSEFFLEHKKYETAEGEWYYGSAKEDYENGVNSSVIILTPSGFEALKVYIARQKVDIDIVSIYIYANNKTISNRLSVVCARRGGCSATFDELNKYFTISDMPIASGQYWNCIHGRKVGEAALDEEGKQTMRGVARNMVFLMKSIALGKEAFGLPEKEKKVYTSFINP